MTPSSIGLWNSPWPAEDAGPSRLAAPRGTSGLGIGPKTELHVTSREALVATMVVLRDPGEVFLLRHTGPPDAISFVEQIDPVTLEPVARSQDLAGGPPWPGGIAAHEDGSLHVVFGNHAHRLDANLVVQASATLPRNRPYNSFVTVPDGHLVTKDFTGPFSGADPSDQRPSELLLLDPRSLEVIDALELTEPSVARLSSIGNEIVVVGIDSVLSVDITGDRLIQRGPGVRYRTSEGQGYGWDAVLDGDVAYFLDDGEGAERFDGSFRDRGIATVPLRLHKIDRRSGHASSVEVSGLAGGLIANPPALDPSRGIAVAFDSGNGVVVGVDTSAMTILWRRALEHASHPVVYPDTGEVVLGHFDRAVGFEQIVVLDLTTGDELARADTASPIQSVVFPAVGFDRDLYWVSMFTVSRIAAHG